MDFDIQFWKQCYSVRHDWRNFNNVSFESILIILHEIYNNSHTPQNLQHSIVSGFCFFWDALYRQCHFQPYFAPWMTRLTINIGDNETYKFMHSVRLMYIITRFIYNLIIEFICEIISVWKLYIIYPEESMHFVLLKLLEHFPPPTSTVNLVQQVGGGGGGHRAPCPAS